MSIVRRSKNDKHEAFVKSSGNVFADLGLPNADAFLVKTDLMSAILQEIERRNLTEHQAAALTGITQLEVSQIAASSTSFVISKSMSRSISIGARVEE